MTGLEEVNKQKEKILSSIRLRGPSLPVQVSKDLGVSPLFAGAFLSELKAEDKVRLSNMRVGSSPLYYVSGQENLLEGFVEHLNQREREAFKLLQGSGVLQDEKQTPVVRVALRAIKDFAVPVRVRVDGESRLFWKYFLVRDSEVGGIISKGLKKVSRPPEEKKVPPSSPTRPPEEKEERLSQKGKVVEQEDRVEQEKASVKSKAVKKKAKEDSEFVSNVKDYLAGKDVEVLEVFSGKKKEFEARVRIDTLFGKQEYYLIAKDKKGASDNDLAVAWQKSQVERLPALVMVTGELSKKAREHFGNWKNLVKYEKLKF